MSDSDLERILNQFRRELLRKERTAAGQMVRAYGKAWQRIQEELQRLDAEYETIKAIGERPSWEWIYEHNRLKAFRAQVERELLQFAEYAERTIRAEQQEAIEAAGQQAQRVVKAMLGVETGWNAFDTGAIETMVGLTQPDSPLHQLLLSIGGEGAQAAEDALLEGMLLGQNPRAVAGALKSALGLGLSRALTIARTETLRAHREATRASYQANNDLVGGWIWHSAADERTCGCCWAMHGTVHKLEEELNGHPNCRCGMVPVLPGINFKVKPGRELFARLPAEKQIQVLGKKKWEHWKNGDFIFANLSKVRKNNVWGSMTVERSLKELLFEREQLISQIKKLKRDDVLRIGELDGILLEKMGVNITDNLSIVLTGERRLHYLENHAEMEPFEDLLINIISQPDFACSNKQDDDVMILYRKIDEARALRLVIRLQKGKTDYKHSIMSYRFSSLAEYEKDFLRKIYTP